MKETIHPTLHEITISCACGTAIQTMSTQKTSMTVEICSGCHPFFTGKKRFVDTAGKVEKFQKKYANVSYGMKKAKTETDSH